MSDGDHTQHLEIMARLHDIDIPALSLNDLTALVLLALGLGGIAALCIRVIATQFANPALPSLPHAKHNVAQMRPQDERLALLHQLRDQNPERFSSLASQLYTPSQEPKLATLRAEVSRDD